MLNYLDCGEKEHKKMTIVVFQSPIILRDTDIKLMATFMRFMATEQQPHLGTDKVSLLCRGSNILVDLQSLDYLWCSKYAVDKLSM